MIRESVNERIKHADRTCGSDLQMGLPVLRLVLHRERLVSKGEDLCVVSAFNSPGWGTEHRTMRLVRGGVESA